MFYSQLILARKGPLGKVWLAAHWDKKLTKISILSTDISESVESILDPSTPLALRVSGHLMLGVVRIYARKVKYLMADVTEVMWKVKMAYKLNNNVTSVDMVDNGGAAAIDDARFFGHTEPDYDFPELAEMAFSQNMLSQYNELKAARGRTLNQQIKPSQAAAGGDTSSIDFDSRKRDSRKSLLTINEEETSFTGSRSSRVSEIEFMRGDKSRTTLQSLARTSISSVGMKFIEDEIPAYIEEQDMFITDYEQMATGFDDNASAPAKYDYEPPTIDYDDHPPPLTLVHSPDLPGAGEIGSVQGTVLTPEISASDRSLSLQSVEVTVKRKAVPKRKRPMVIIDERVELSSKVIKEHLNNTAPILRRLPGEKLPRREDPEDQVTAEQMLTLPSVRDMCPELLELFQMTMTMGELPFPRLEQYQQDQREEVEEEAVEIARYGKSRDVQTRVSVLDEGVESDHADRASIGLQEGGPYGDAPYDDFYAATEDHQYAAEMLVPSPLSVSRASPSQEEQSRARPQNSSFLDNLEDQLPGEGISKVASIETCSARTAKVIQLLKTKFSDCEELPFAELTGVSSRRHAANCFFEVLQLNTWGLINAQQTEPFGDISLRPCDKLWVAAQ